MATLCDTCARPGACCSGFHLSEGALRDGTPEQADAVLADIVTCTRHDGTGSFIWGRGAAAYHRACADGAYANVRLGLPFRRLRRDEEGRWRYACPLLGPDGRCMRYEARPAACRAFVAGASDACRGAVASARAPA